MGEAGGGLPGNNHVRPNMGMTDETPRDSREQTAKHWDARGLWGPGDWRYGLSKTGIAAPREPYQVDPVCGLCILC
jgi:hypothetical protein